jgi:hypothetical protein
MQPFDLYILNAYLLTRSTLFISWVLPIHLSSSMICRCAGTTALSASKLPNKNDVEVKYEFEKGFIEGSELSDRILAAGLRLSNASHGRGVVCCVSGDVDEDCEEGQWVEGKLEGRAKKSYPDGRVLEGEFREGKL